MKRLFISFVASATVLSCGQNKPKIEYSEKIDTTSVIDERISDTTKILVSELPVRFDSTDVLIFAIGLVDLEERDGYSKFGSGSKGAASISAVYFQQDQLIGNFINLVFKGSDGAERKLTDKKIQIRSVTFLRDIFKKTKRGYLLYEISDRDSNGDKELNHSDLEALYISKIDGSDFRKLTKELHELYNWSFITGDEQMYFRTLEDENKDGELNNKDKFHYYQIRFSGDSYSLKEFNPVRVFE